VRTDDTTKAVERLLAQAIPPKTDDTWLRPGALAKLHDPNPAFVTGLSADFLAGRYGRKVKEVA
jgi:hypothetical protein